MYKTKLNQIINSKNSLLCVGLDPDLQKIPPILKREKNPLLKFNREIISATSGFAAAYKPNIAFYEVHGVAGWHLLEKTLEALPAGVAVIADAKRGDIGNTSRMYAETFFDTFNFDAITVSPYMGSDSVQPFLDFSDRGIYVLCLTSNAGAGDFQYLETEEVPFFLKVAEKAAEWNRLNKNCGLVVGATRSENISAVRRKAPNLPLLIPGVGAQGGDLRSAVISGLNSENSGILINASRSILYAGNDHLFGQAAANTAQQIRDEINIYRSEKQAE